MKTNTFLTVAAALCASTSANPTKKSCKGVSKLATFDTLPTLPGAAELTPVGVYDGINWEAFDVLEVGINGTLLTGLEAKSGDQVAVNGITNELTTGNPTLVPAGKYKSFSLDSLWFGCVANSVSSATGVPTSCTVAITAYLPKSKVPYTTVNYEFNPKTLLKSPLVEAVFPNAKPLGRVEAAIVSSALPGTTTALFIDSVKYTLFPCY